jgi:ATP-dependent RNA helicase DDX10/DBP4
MQIFQVLQKIGSHHTFSAGLLIGGKSLAEEQSRLQQINVLICTPGRLLQHMDQTPSFHCENLQLLVLDEADRILDMGFKSTLDAIVQHLPPTRQTLLFSATQTSSVQDLARLSLRDPEYIAVHADSQNSTPERLQGYYIEVPLQDKLDTLFGFIKTHLKTKALVFMSSCKQVRYVYETFRHLHPGVPLLHLHGKQKQTLRLSMTQKFTAANHAFLFSTDIAARGLDFPLVDWVVQLDCPEDVDTYIHRVGRTARFERGGKALLMLLPTESAFLAKLGERRVPIDKIVVKVGKTGSVKQKLNGMVFKDPELKYLAQKAFSSYVRSIYLQKDKEVFSMAQLPLEEFAESLGLAAVPHVKFVLGSKLKLLKNAPHLREDSLDEESEKQKDKLGKTKHEKMFERRNQTVLSKHYEQLHSGGNTVFKVEEPDDLDGDIFTTKRKIDWDTTDIPSGKLHVLSLHSHTLTRL